MGAQLSGSKAGILLHCSRAFDDDMVAEETGSKNAGFGTKVHQYVNRALRGIEQEDGDDPDVVMSGEALLSQVVQRGWWPEGSPISEPSYAYNPVSTKATFLGTDLERDYSAVADNEIPMSLDLTYLDGRDLYVVDYKTYVGNTPIEDDAQLLLGAMATSKLFQPERVFIERWEVTAPPKVWVLKHEVDTMDLLAFADRLEDQYKRINQRSLPIAGAHCRWCPCKGSCPAQSRNMSALLDQPIDDGMGFTLPIRDMEHARFLASHVGVMKKRVEELYENLKRYADEKGAIPMENGMFYRAVTTKRQNFNSGLAKTALERHGEDLANFVQVVEGKTYRACKTEG